ncbi:acyl-CoA dehydrogenase family protein [Sinosporangium siamense]|uniref:Acyl-CoA dehydrogenase n=1 Tax=Sinosporangium siamense TaxID=1367973 RepID=A0A919RB51_9ACTN|nr:acyl-CoA dehydrogenase family protein [Sinosporangium siamense]GII90685.1 acyl-CoA dehydrogenase [Sinosporangium siamense]
MTLQIEKSPIVGSLREPITPEGRDLLDIVTTHLPAIGAVAAENDRQGTFPAAVFEGLRKDGVMGGTVPTEFGGFGVGCMHDVALVLMKVAEADASTALALHMQLSRGLTLAYEWRRGSSVARSLAERVLRKMGTEGAVVCTGVKDAPKGGIVTTLLPAEGGGWTLSGRKTLVSLAPIATDFAIYARAHVPDGPPRYALAVLPRQSPGLTVLDNWDGLGMRASGTVDIVFDNCPIAPEDVLLREVAGERNIAILAGQTVSSIAMLGIYTGVAQAARDLAVGQLKRRGKVTSGAVRTLVAEMDARLFTLRSSVAGALAVADALAYDEVTDPAERGLQMMTPFQCAKLMVNRLAPAIVSDCLTVVGGASYSGSNPLSRLYRDVRAGGFMQPYTYPDAVDYLSGQVFGPLDEGQQG